MVSLNQPDRVPPAFQARAPKAASFIGLEDDQVLKLAAIAYRKHDWARFDDAMAELAGRAQRHILAKLREQGALDDSILAKLREQEALDDSILAKLHEQEALGDDILAKLREHGALDDGEVILGDEDAS